MSNSERKFGLNAEELAGYKGSSEHASLSPQTIVG